MHAGVAAGAAAVRLHMQSGQVSGKDGQDLSAGVGKQTVRTSGSTAVEVLRVVTDESFYFNVS